MRYILISLITLTFMQCSTLDTRYFLAPEYRYRDGSGCEVPCTRYAASSAAGPVVLRYWAVSGEQAAFFGPCLLPVWPRDNSFIAGQDIHMRWRLELPTGAAIRIEKDSFEFQNNGEAIKPTGLTQYEYEPATGYLNIEEYYSLDEYEQLPESLEIRTAMEFDIWLLGVRIGEVEDLSVQPRLSLAGVPLSLPRFKFHADQEYTYHPYEIPLYFPGPR